MTPEIADTSLPILPLRDIVVFPNMIVPLFVGRKKSIKALEKAEKDNKDILLVAQKDANIDEPEENDIYRIGTIANILQLLKLPDGTVKVLVEGIERAEISAFIDNNDFFESVTIPVLDKPDDSEKEISALSRAALNQFEQYIKLNRKIPPEVLVNVNQISDSVKLADTLSAHINLKISDKQSLLEIKSLKRRLEKIISFMESEIDVLQVEKKN